MTRREWLASGLGGMALALSFVLLLDDDRLALRSYTDLGNGKNEEVLPQRWKQCRIRGGFVDALR